MSKCAAIICLFLFLVAGCNLGDRAVLSRTILLSFPKAETQHKLTLSINEPQVQDALRLIDTTLISVGLTRDPNPPAAADAGFIASYTIFSSTGLRQAGGPNVYIRGDQLEVKMVELGNHSGHPSSTTKKICDSLRKEFSNHYGVERVKLGYDDASM